MRARIGARTSERQRTAFVALLIGLGAVVLRWRNDYFMQPTPGLDPSWMGGLHMARHMDVNFGPGIDFTYGPLGFLGLPINYYRFDYSLAFAFRFAVLVVLAAGIAWLVRPSFGTSIVGWTAGAAAVDFLMGMDIATDIAMLVAALIGCIVVATGEYSGSRTSCPGDCWGSGRVSCLSA